MPQTTAAPRRRRLLALGGVLSAAVVAVALAVVVSSSGGDDAPARPTASATPATSLAGIPQDGVTLGRPDAPVRVLEFADLQCPFCAQAAAGPVADVIASRVRTGQARIEFHDLAFLGPDSEKARLVGVSAAAEDRLWQFVEAFFARQGAEGSGYVTDGFLREVAQAAGVRDTTATADAGRLQQQTRSLAQRFGVESTPTFVVLADGAEPDVVDAGGLAAAVERAVDRT